MMVREGAFHEAAHAVVAAYLKVPFSYVTAVAGPKNGGEVHGQRFRVRPRLYVKDPSRSFGIRRRSDEELKDIYRRRVPDVAVVALAARAAMEGTEGKKAGGRLSASELDYKGDERIVKDIAGELGIHDLAAWRKQQLNRARDIVATPHVARAIHWVASKLEAEWQMHAMKRGNGRLPAKEVRWVLRAASGLESGRKKAA